MGIFTYNTRVNLCDIGENNKLTNKAILEYMQEAASAHSDSAGFGLNNVPTTHLGWIILNWKLKVFSRPVWNTKITVKTWSRPIEKLYFYRDFEMYDEANNLIAIASSKWILINTETHAIQRALPDMNEKYQSTDKLVFDTPMVEKLKEPETSEMNFEYAVQRRDVDTNHHVNNIHYLEYAYEALPEDIFLKNDFTNIEIMYKHEAKLGDNIVGLYSKTENDEHIITIKGKEANTLHAIIKLY